MNNSPIEAIYVDPDPTSALFLGIWFIIIGVLGIPLNIFIVVATVKVQEIRAVSSNMFIGSLALSDALFMLSTLLDLPYVLTSNETLCKMIGLGLSLFALLGNCIAPFLAVNRYAIVCRHQEKLARFMLGIFSRKGTKRIILLLWLFELMYQLPYVILDTLGMNTLGLCTTIKTSTNDVFIRVYYYCGMLGVFAFTNILLLVFYRKVLLWVKSMSAQLSLSVETKQTVEETKNVLLLTKWVTLIPLICQSPVFLFGILFELNSEIVPVGVARFAFSSVSLIPLLNAIITLKLARPYRLALKRACARAKLSSILFLWMIEGHLHEKIDVTHDNHP